MLLILQRLLLAGNRKQGAGKGTRHQRNQQDVRAELLPAPRPIGQRAQSDGGGRSVTYLAARGLFLGRALSLRGSLGWRQPQGALLTLWQQRGQEANARGLREGRVPLVVHHGPGQRGIHGVTRLTVAREDLERRSRERWVREAGARAGASWGCYPWSRVLSQREPEYQRASSLALLAGLREAVGCVCATCPAGIRNASGPDVLEGSSLHCKPRLSPNTRLLTPP